MNNYNQPRPNQGGFRGGPPPQQADSGPVIRLVAEKGFADGESLEKVGDFGVEIGGSQKATITQMRKVYNQLRTLKRQSDATQTQAARETLIQYRARVLKAQIAYGEKRELYPSGFRRFFDACMDRLMKKPEEMDELVTFFEVFYAYAYSIAGNK